jgi:hypothetical protein
VVHVQHQFIANTSSNIKLHAFLDTKFLCVEEINKDANRLKLTYYPLPLYNYGKPCAFYESKIDEFTYGMKVDKANNHSMVIWFEKSLKNRYLYIFYLSDFGEGRYSRIKINNIENNFIWRLSCILHAW